MKTYKVTVITTVKEVYIVEAESEDEASDIWCDCEPDIQDTIDILDVSIKEVNRFYLFRQNNSVRPLQESGGDANQRSD